MSVKSPRFGEIYLRKDSVSLLKGKSGAGKSTVISYLIYNQNCKLDNQFYRELYQQGQLYCYMNSNNSFFEDSILGNIVLQKKTFNIKKLINL